MHIVNDHSQNEDSDSEQVHEERDLLAACCPMRFFDWPGHSEELDSLWRRQNVAQLLHVIV